MAYYERSGIYIIFLQSIIKNYLGDACMRELAILSSFHED